jgi:hypothetical protein
MFQSFSVLLSYADRDFKTGQSLSKESIKRRLQSSGFNIIWFGTCRTFRRNISSPPSPSNSKASMKSAETGAKHTSSCRLLLLAFVWLTLRLGCWGRYVPPKSWTLSELRNVTTQKCVLFVVTITREPQIQSYQMSKDFFRLNF